MKSTSQELLRDAIKNEFGNRLDELDSAVKSLT